MNFLKGKRTYIVMIITILIAGFNGFSEYCGTLVDAPAYCVEGGTPEWVYALCASFGMVFRKAADK